MRSEDLSLSSLVLQPIPPSVRVNLTGQRFDHLLVEAYAYRNAKSQTFWLCRCDCGTPTIVVSYSLQKGDTTSCGCRQQASIRARAKSQRKDLTGQRFGRLVVDGMVWGGRNAYARCTCDCGTSTLVRGPELLNRNTQSCGCLQADATSAARRVDLTDQPFGRLVVRAMFWKDGEGWAQCVCACGAEPLILGTRLVSGHTRSCGCLKQMAPEVREARKHLPAYKRLVRAQNAPTDFRRTDERFMLAYWQHRCAICGRSADFWHRIAAGHWIPLRDPATLGTIPANILPLCHAKKAAGTVPGPRACNNSKGSKDPVVWLTTRLGARKAASKLREIAAYFAATRQRA